MESVSSQLISEIRILLFAEEDEFAIERLVINDIICPQLRKHFLFEYNVDFNIIDPGYTARCSTLPPVDVKALVLSELGNCQAISCGLSALIFLGDTYGRLRPPKALTHSQFTQVLQFLQSKNDPSWIIFNSKYQKTDNGYLLDNNGGEEELISVLNSISSFIDNQPSENFPESFIEEYLTLTTSRILSRCGENPTNVSNTQLFHRTVVNTNPIETKTKELSIQKKLKETYEKLLKATKRKFLQDTCVSYTITKSTYLDANKTIKTDLEKVFKMGESINVSSKKSRLLNKDLRISSSFEMYLQIFCEHVSKLLYDKCKMIFLSKSYMGSILNLEMATHSTEVIEFKNEELREIIQRYRERELNIFDTYIKNTSAKMPGLLFGAPGSGRTELLKSLAEKMKESSEFIVVFRQCGLTLGCNNLQSMIISLTQELNVKSNKVHKNVAYADYAVSVYDFWTGLNRASQSKSVVILLDDVDVLYPSSHTEMLKWLPYPLPNKVKCIMTTSSESFHNTFKKRFDASSVVTISTLESKDAIKIFTTHLERGTETIPENVLTNANFHLQENSTPLFINTMVNVIYRVTDHNAFNSSLKDMIKLYLSSLLDQSAFPVIVKHIFCYLSLSRFGLSLSEITDILSLDNRIYEILQFDIRSRTSFRFPIYLVVDIINKSKFLFKFCQTERRLLIRFKHRIFQVAAVEFFQLLQEEGGHFYQNLLDYWTSRYDGDKMKPLFESDDESASREGSYLYLKRSIAAQPYFSLGKMREITANQRRISELPNLLITYGKANELYKYILFNYEYLFSTLHQYGLNYLMAEVYFCRQLNDVKGNPEIELLILHLRQLSIEVIKEAHLLAPELSGRLSHLVGTNSLITMLHQQIDNVAPRTNVLFAAIPCFSTIDTDNMVIDVGETCTMLLVAPSADNRFIASLHKENTSLNNIITTWDPKTATKAQIINIGAIKNTKFLDMFYMPQREEYVIINYEDSANSGFFVVSLELSTVENIIKFSRKMNPKLEYVSKSHFYVNINGEVQTFCHPTGQKDHMLSKQPWPTVMTPNDKYQVGPKQPTAKEIASNKINYNLRVLNGGSGELMSQLAMNTNASYMMANARNEVLFVTTKLYGLIFRFDIGQIAKKDAKKLKSNLELNINDQMNLGDDIKSILQKYYPTVKSDKLSLTIDEKYLMSEYNIGGSMRIVGVWNLSNKSLVFCRQMEYSVPVNFSTDGVYLYSYSKSNGLLVCNLNNGSVSTIEFSIKPIHAMILKSGSVFLVFTSSIQLTTLKALSIDKDVTSEQNVEFQPQNFCSSLKNSKIVTDSVTIFDNSTNTTKFSYYQLSKNLISTLNIPQTVKSLTDFPLDRFLTPGGDKLLLIFGFKPRILLKRPEDYDLDGLILQVNENGYIIESLDDLRKPQLPKINYFLGKLDNSNNPSLNAYEQKIIKVIDLKNPKPIFQISLVGEKVLNITDSFLFTFKTDFSNPSLRSEDAYDIISVYHLTEGRLLNELFLEHPVVESILMPNADDKLLVCCGKNGKILKLLGGQYFSTMMNEIDIQTLLKYHDEYARTSVTTKLFVFPKNSDNVLVQYSWLETGSNSIKIEKDSHYALIDIVRKEILCQFSSSGKVSDVSSDGCFAIDSSLSVYDLSKGLVTRKLQIASESNQNIDNYVARFSEDASFVVVYNSNSNNLLIIKNDEYSFVIGKSLLSSVKRNSERPSYRLFTALGGRIVIVSNEEEFKIFIVRTNVKQGLSEVAYKSNTDRIKKLLYNA